MTAIRHFGARLSAAGKVLLAGLVIVGVSGVATVAATSPAFAAGAPTVGAGYGAFSNSPVVNLTGCTGTTSSETLTCTNNPITAGVTVGMGAYGVDLDSTTPNSVTSVTATTVVLVGRSVGCGHGGGHGDLHRHPGHRRRQRREPDDHGDQHR